MKHKNLMWNIQVKGSKDEELSIISPVGHATLSEKDIPAELQLMSADIIKEIDLLVLEMKRIALDKEIAERRLNVNKAKKLERTEAN
jgi:hypothetical protein